MHNSFFSSETLIKKFWDPIWDNGIKQEIRIRIYNAIINDTPNNMDEILNILKNINLKCDAVDLIINSIRVVNDEEGVILWNTNDDMYD
jgi:hypothetical protein